MDLRVQKSGVTLVEVLITSAVTALSVLSLLGGFSVARKVVHTNTEALKADNVAFDLIWNQLHKDKDYEEEEMSSSNTKVFPVGTIKSTESLYRSAKFSKYPNYLYKIDHSRPTNGVVSITVSVYDSSSSKLVRKLEVLRSAIPRENPRVSSN